MMTMEDTNRLLILPVYILLTRKHIAVKKKNLTFNLKLKLLI